MRICTIYDIDGEILYQAHAKNLHSLVQKLIEEGKSFARADLSKKRVGVTDLFDRKNLDGMNFDEANLDGQYFRGSSLIRATFRKASLYKCKFIGADVTRAVYDEADLTEADFTASTGPWSSFCFACVDETKFIDFTAASSKFNYAYGKETKFIKSTMYNSVFDECNFYNPDFTEANIGHRLMSNTSDENHNARLAENFPNRTRHAVIIGGTYTKAHLPKTVPAMRDDRRTGKAVKTALFATTGVSMVLGIEKATELLTEAGFTHVMSASTGAILIMGLAYLGKELAAEYIRDTLSESLVTGAHHLRQFVKNASNQIANRASLVCAIGKEKSLAPLRMALSATADHVKSRGIWSSFKHFLTKDFGHVVVCDRRHLASALATLSSNRQRNMASSSNNSPQKLACELPHDIVLMRCLGTHKNGKDIGPCVVTFHKNGDSSAIWPLEDKTHVKISYNQAGDIVKCKNEFGKEINPEDINLPDSHVTNLAAYFMFEESLLADHGLENWSYPSSSHTISEGMNGSIVVKNENNVVNNPDYFAIVTVDGDGYSVLNGQMQKYLIGENGKKLSRRERRKSKADEITQEVQEDFGSLNLAL